MIHVEGFESDFQWILMHINYEIRTSSNQPMMNFNNLRGMMRKPQKADKSAVGAINRPLLMFVLFCSSALIRQGKRKEHST